MESKITRTRGNVIVENIKIGDIHYEFEYNLGAEVKVLTLPTIEDGVWRWKSENVNTGNVVDYLVSCENEHYSPKLYDYKAYIVTRWV